jgi:polysaccharide pyruvyl transferase WcaK-like protein
MQKKKILICGCIYGAGNIGDEAILSGLLRLIPTNFEIGVCVQGNRALYEEAGLKVFNTDRLGVLSGIWWADHIILGGASLMTDPMGPDYPIRNCAQIIKGAVGFGKPCTFVGIGATNLKSDTSKQLVSEWYAKANKFFVRNHESKEAVLKHTGIESSRVVPICDPAFLLTDKIDTAAGLEILKEHNIIPQSGHPLIAVSVVNEGFETGRTYHEEIAKACDLLIEKDGAQVVFVYSEIREGEKYDIAAARRVQSYMKHESSELPPVFFRPEEFISILACFNSIIAMRMHVLIMAALSGTECAVIVREDKVRQILNDLTLSECGHIDNVTSEMIVERVRKTIGRNEIARKHLISRVSSLQKVALENFSQNIDWNRSQAIEWRALVKFLREVLGDIKHRIRVRVLSKANQ